MERSNFEKLEVFQLAEKLSDEIWCVVAEWDVFTKSTIGRQIVRSADSIAANIAEGYGRGSYKDNRRFIRIARGSLNETQYWLRRAYRRSLLNEKCIERIKLIIMELAPRLNAYLSSIGTSKQNNTETAGN